MLRNGQASAEDDTWCDVTSQKDLADLNLTEHVGSTMRRNACKKAIIADSSRNTYRVGEKHYIIAALSSQELAVAYADRSVQRNYYTVKTAICQREPQDIFPNILLESDLKFNSGTDPQTESIDSRFTACVRQELPCTILLINLFARHLQALKDAGISITEDQVLVSLKRLLSDPLFYSNEQMARAAHSFVMVMLESAYNDSSIRACFERISDRTHANLLVPNSDKTEKRRVIRKSLLTMHKGQDLFDVLAKEVSHLVQIGRLTKHTILRADRVFQRCSGISGHYKPVCRASNLRWETVDLTELANRTSNNDSVADYIRSEDEGILRDVLSNVLTLYFAIQRQKKDHPALKNNQEVSTKLSIVNSLISSSDLEAMLSPSWSWVDPLRDKLIDEGADISEDALIDRQLILPIHEQKIEMLVGVCAVTLLYREETFDRGAMYSPPQKWVKLYNQKELWALVSKEGARQKLELEELTQLLSQSPLEEQDKAIPDPSLKPQESHVEGSKRPQKEIEMPDNNQQRPLSDSISLDVLPREESRKEQTPERHHSESDPSQMNIFLPEQTSKSFDYENRVDKQLHSASPKEENKSRDQSTSHDESSLATNRPDLHKSKQQISQTKLSPRTSNVDLTLKFAEKINYGLIATLENFKNAYRSFDLQDITFYLGPAGSSVYASRGELIIQSFEMVLVAQNNDNEQVYEVFSLSDDYRHSFCIWGAVALLHFDSFMAERFPIVGAQYKNCLLYADLRHSIQSDGALRGIIAFVPLLKDDKNLSKRGVLADEFGIFLIGGNSIKQAKKKSLSYANSGEYYDIEDDLGDSWQPSHEKTPPSATIELFHKFEEVLLAQDENHLFVAGRAIPAENVEQKTEAVVIEVFEKESLVSKLHFSTNLQHTSDPSIQTMLTRTQIGTKKQQMVILARFSPKTGITGCGFSTEKLDDALELDASRPFSKQFLDKLSDLEEPLHRKAVQLANYQSFAILNRIEDQVGLPFLLYDTTPSVQIYNRKSDEKL